MAKSLDGNLVKKAHAQTKYTLDEVEHLEKCMDPVTGPLYFAKTLLRFNTPHEAVFLLNRTNIKNV